MIYPNVKILKSFMYGGIAAPILVKVADELGIEVPDNVRTAMNIGGPIVSATAGVTIGRRLESRHVASVAGTKEYGLYAFGPIGKKMTNKVVYHDISIPWNTEDFEKFFPSAK